MIARELVESLRTSCRKLAQRGVVEDDVGGHGVLLRALEAPAAQARDEILVDVGGDAGSDAGRRHGRIDVEDAEPVGRGHLDQCPRSLDESDPAADVGVARGREDPVRERPARRRRCLQRPAERGNEAPSPERPGERRDRIDDRSPGVLRQRRGRARDRRRSTCERSAHVAAPARRVERLPEVGGHLLVPTDPRLRERDDPVRARLRDEPRALQERLDALGRVGRRGLQRDPHASPLVEVATEETRLLEHPDEHARVAIGHDGGELGGVDEALPVPERAVDRAKLRHRGHVGDREAPERPRVGRARQQERLARLAVAPGPSHHLHVALERVRVADETHEPHVGLVDAHAEGGRRDDDLRAIGDEVVLDACPLARLETRVVMLGPEAVAAQYPCQLLGRASRSRVDDRGAAAERAKALDEDLDPVFRVGDLLHVVAETRAHDAGVHDLELAPERLPDVARGLRSCRRRHPEDRRVAERLEAAPDEEVVGAEVVPPHAHAVHLVHDDEPDPDSRQELDEARLAEPFRRCVDEPRLARLDGGEALRPSPPARGTS